MGNVHPSPPWPQRKGVPFSLRFEHPAERYIGMLAPLPDVGSAGVEPGSDPEGQQLLPHQQGQIAYAGIVTNPNWLLATMAQSAAALVAIVGGFLVSRVVTLSSERQGLEQRGRELEQRMQGHQERLQEATHRRREAGWERFIELRARECAERYVKYGSVSLEWLVEESPLVGATSEEMLVMARRLIRIVRQAHEHFERGGDMPDSSDADRDQDIYEVVNNARSPGQSPPSTFNLEVFKVRWARYEKLLKDERELQDGLSALQLEGNFVRTEAARVTKPEGLRLAAGAFTYLTVVGVMAPIVGLAWRPVPSDTLWRIVLVSLFATGLLALGGYLIWAIRQLSKPSKLQGRDHHTQADAS